MLQLDTVAVLLLELVASASLVVHSILHYANARPYYLCLLDVLG